MEAEAHAATVDDDSRSLPETIATLAPGVDNSILQTNEKNLLKVMGYTSSINDWSVLPLILGLTEAQLKQCQKTENPHKAIITRWLQQGNASWAGLVGALKDDLVGQVAVADKIATEKCTTTNRLVQKNSSKILNLNELEPEQVDTPTILPKDTLPVCDTPAQRRKNRIAEGRQKIENYMHEVENGSCQGIIFVIGVLGADGTVRDVENVTTTFKKLEFAVYSVTDPTSSEIIELIEAAAGCKYRLGYKFVAFYFAGHGGRDQSGNAFIKGMKVDNSDAEIVLIEKYIVDPLKHIQSFSGYEIIRFFFFDCCQVAQSTATQNYRGDPDPPSITPQSSPNQLIAYATSVGQRSFGDNKNGGVWTYHLCKNLMTKSSLVDVLAQTNDNVKKERSTFQSPMTVSSIGKISLNKAASTKVLALLQETVTQLHQHLNLSKVFGGLLIVIFSVILFWCIRVNPLFNGTLIETLAESSPIVTTLFLMLIIVTGAVTACVLYFIHLKHVTKPATTGK